MSVSAVRLAMMERFADISGVVVPADPLPLEIENKSIIVFPRIGNTSILSRGKDGGVAFQAEDVMQVEYHRVIPYRELGTVIGDVTSMIESIREATWSEVAGGKFDGTVLTVSSVSLAHFGAIGWNEWTFGARLEISYTHLSHVSP